MSRLSDVFTDHVLDDLERLCDRLTQAPPRTWQQLIAAGRAMDREDADHFTRGVALAIHCDRAALLIYAWQRIHDLVQRQLPITVASERVGDQQPRPAASAAVPQPRVTDRDTFEPDGQAIQTAAALLPLYATIMATVLADIIDEATFTELTKATSLAVGQLDRTPRPRPRS